MRALALVKDEPVDIHGELLKICNLLMEANSSQKDFQTEVLYDQIKRQ